MVRGLSWPEVDSYLLGHEQQIQRQQELPRLAAWSAFNAFQIGLKDPEISRSPQEFWPLPLVDRPAPVKIELVGETLAEMRARLERQNRERLAARAAATA